MIAEDEPLLAAELQEALGLLWPELQIAAVAADGVRALQAIEAHSPSVVFLDIQMPKMTGLDVARQLGGKAHVVFVTAYDQHAIQAFEAERTCTRPRSATSRRSTTRPGTPKAPAP